MRTLSHILILLTSIIGCTELPTEEGIDALLPVITVYRPATGDTIPYGQHEIIYDVTNSTGIAHYELYVDGEFLDRFDAYPDGRRPAIIWEIDSSFLHTRLRYFIRAYDVEGNSITSPTMSDIFIQENTDPPDPPENLRLLRLSDTAVNLLWEDSSTNELGFEVWRKVGSEAYARIQTLPRNSISANDMNLVPLVVYRYKVRAVNNYGFGESNEVSTGSDVVFVLPPTDLRATALATRTIELRWADNSDNELAFIIERKVTSGTLFSQIAAVGPNQTLFVDEWGLSPGTSFTYRVAARGQFGHSGWSNEATVLTLYQDVSPPSDLSAAFDTAAEMVILTWKDNSVLEIETRVERKTGGSEVYEEIGRVSVDMTEYPDSTIRLGATYFYRVRGYTSDGGYSAYSNEASVVVPG